MIATLHLPEPTGDAQVDYDTLRRLLHAWHHTANELDNQVHAMRNKIATDGGRITLLQRRVDELEDLLIKERATRGENPSSS